MKPPVDDEAGFDSIRLVHPYQVLASICAHKAEECMSSHMVHHLVVFEQRKAIFQASIVEVREVLTHPPFLVRFFNQ